jgi:hypothetical protein
MKTKITLTEKPLVESTLQVLAKVLKDAGIEKVSINNTTKEIEWDTFEEGMINPLTFAGLKDFLKHI